MVLLEPGEMRVRDAAGAERAFAAGEGFARIDRESVTVFSDMAEDADAIALEQEEEAKSRAETRWPPRRISLTTNATPRTWRCGSRW